MGEQVGKRLTSLLLIAATVIFMLTGTISSYTVVRAEGDGITIRLHYNRPDGKYDGWDVWMWPEGGEGAAYEFAEVDGEMIATAVIEPGFTSVGFIVRTEDWEKDVNKDQFIDISEMVSGSVDIMVESGVEGYTKEYGEDAVTGTKLKSAIYNGDGTITAQFTGEVSKEQEESLNVRSKYENLDVASFALKEDGEEFEYLITMAQEMDATRSYYIDFDGTTYNVNMPIIYSTEEFENLYTYEGDDLGANYTSESTAFRVWAPTADKVMLNLYESGNQWEDDLIESCEMVSDVNGTWLYTKEGDLNGVYYTYSVVVDGVTSEACDPYARTTGFNGKRAMVIDLDTTDPEGWDTDTNPHAGESITDAVIYELHMRDLSTDESSGITNVGKFLEFTENGTTTESGIATGIDHIVDMGITHVQILPMYDFGSVDETHTYSNLYNWGYDPVNYNVPEGSYSTDAGNGAVRVNEAKQMVKALHDNGLSVVMDVVYNHVYSASDFCFNKIVPGYFSRINDDGTYENGSGCGNDTASERTMVQKYIVDSVCYWADEYHIDGFRFDLVGLIDTETVNKIVEEVHKTHPDVIFYGEGWSLDTTPTKEGYELATQKNSSLTPDFGYFNDTIRDAIKGHVFNTDEVGYASGATNQTDTIISSFMARQTWCTNPTQIINYVSCHDNLTLFDRLATSREDASFEELVKMNNLSAAIYLTSEGVPLMQAGEELLKSKVKEDGSFDDNSYASGDDINAIKWNTLDDEAYMNTYNYYKGLIAFRKAHPVLRLTDSSAIADAVTSVEGLDKNVVAFDINGEGVEGETASEIYVIFNPNETEITVDLPNGNWNVYVNGDTAGTTPISTITNGKALVSPISAMILIKEDVAVDNGDEAISTADTSKSDAGNAKAAESEDNDKSLEKESENGLINMLKNQLPIIGGVVVAIAIVIAAVIAFCKKKK